jgi:peptidoglycan/xylan/chitin deacetylase (PgdA/CDA1 family)
MFHSVAAERDARWIAPRNRVAPEAFEAQMRFLSRRRRVIDLDSFIEGAAAGREFPVGAVVLTFDDGYLDNLTVAAPILKRYKLPATLYLPTGYITRGENQWADVLYSAFRLRRSRFVEVSGQGRADLNVDRDRTGAYETLSQRLLTSGYSDRSQLLDDVVRQLDPESQPDRQTLNWSEVRGLAEDIPGFSIGVHTHDHLDLTSFSTSETQREMSQSIDCFESEMGYKPIHFSFPYGRSSGELLKQLPGLGLASAMTRAEPTETEMVDPFDLRRIEADSSMRLLPYWTSGAHPGLSLLLFGRS